MGGVEQGIRMLMEMAGNCGSVSVGLVAPAAAGDCSMYV